MTREQRLIRPLSERDEDYLEDCQDADIWAHMAVSAIMNYAALYRGGVVPSAVAAAAMLALSNQE